MLIPRSYSVVISGGSNLPKKTLQNTVDIFRKAVGYFIDLDLANWGSKFTSSMTHSELIKTTEELCLPSSRHVNACYDFPKADPAFNRFPSYLRRAAITAAFGKVSAYKTSLAKWEHQPHKKGAKPPGVPKAGKCYPPLYRNNMFEGKQWADYCQLNQHQSANPSAIPADIIDTFRHARIKVYENNAWKWIDVTLKQSDVKYILCNCAGLEESAPTLIGKGKKWKLAFLFKKEVQLSTKAVLDQIAVSVDLGINNACVCSAMKADGTVLGRKFLKLPREEAQLRHVLNLNRKAQSNGSRKNKKLWERAKGINRYISIVTAGFIIDFAIERGASVIVMERLNLQGKKRGGSKRQRLSLWKARDVQRMVERKAHMCDMRFSTVCAWNTSRLAFDGSGYVRRDKDNYSMCTFPNPQYIESKKGGKASKDKDAKYEGGKRYNCDLSASYNIGARYFVREILKSLDENIRRRLKAKAPEFSHGSTCCLNTLFNLHAGLRSIQNEASA